MQYLKYAYLIVLLASIISCQPKTDNGESKQEIKATAIIKQLQGDNPVMISNKIITGNLDFTKAGQPSATHLNFARTIIQVPVTFYNCTFRDTVRAFAKKAKGVYATTFMHNLSFLKCDLNGGLDLRAVKVKDDFNFAQSISYGQFNLNSGNLAGKRNALTESRFKKEVILNNALINGDIRAMQAHFDAGLTLRRSDCRGDVVLGRCRFPQGFDISSTRFHQQFRMVFSQIGKRADLQFSTFLGEVDLSASKVDSLMRMHNNTFYTMPVQKNFSADSLSASDNKLLIYSPLDSLFQP